LLLCSGTLGLLAFWAAQHLPPQKRRAPRRQPLWRYQLDRLVGQELRGANLALQPVELLLLMTGMAGVGALLTWPFHSLPVLMIGSVTFSLVPYQLVKMRLRQRNRAIQGAVEPLLVQLAKLCEVRHHPFLALSDALPMIQPPLRAEFEQAIAEARAGLPLPEALRQVAGRCADNFYLHQVAELVAITVVNGGDLAGGLQRLAGRLRSMAELQAEEAAELFGYKWLTRILFAAALLPLPYWALTGSQNLALFQTNGVAQALLVWVLLSGLAIATLPYWLAIDDE
jgi:Flp pilus assembly protein TadB